MELRVFCVRFRSHPIYRPILIKHRGYCRGLKMTMEWVAIWTNTGKRIRCFYWTWHRLGDDSRNYTTFVVLAHQGNPSRILFFRSTWFPASFDPFIQLLKESLQDSLDGLNIYSPHSQKTPRSGELRMQKLKSHLVRTQSLNVLPLKCGVGQYIAIHATLTARNFFRAYFYPSGPFICIFSKTSPNFFLCWLWLTPDPV